MASLVEAHDWASTSLGPIETWPAVLRSTTDLMLVHGFPMVVLWGPDLVQVYNDGFGVIMGVKHPGGLGQPTRECWPEVWHINAPIYARVRSGETVTFKDAPYPITRSGRLEDAWFTLTYSPIRDEGAIVGVLVTVFEVTAEVLARRSLAQSEKRLRAFVTASTDVVYRMSADWTEMRVLEERTAPSNTDAPSGLWLDRYIPSDDRAPVHAAIAGAIRTGSTFELQHRVIRADGSLGWSQSRAVPIRDEAGDILEWLGTATDVTDKAKAAEALHESEGLRRVALVAGRMGTWRWDLAARLVWGDAQFLSLWGFPPSDDPLPLSRFTERMSPGGAAEMEVIVTEAIEAGQDFDGPLEIVAGPTAGRWIQWRGRAADERSSVLHGVTFDITEQKRADEALRTSEAKYRTLFETMTEGYAIGELRRDASGQAVDWRFIESNPAFQRHTGMDRQALTGRWFSELFPGTDRTDRLDVYQSVVDLQCVRSFEDYWPLLDRWLGGVASPAGDGRFYILYRDISEQKRLEFSLRETGERQSFLLTLSDTLRVLDDPAEIQDSAMDALGRRLASKHTLFLELELEPRTVRPSLGYADGVQRLRPVVALPDFDALLMDRYRQGETIVSNDAAVDAHLGAEVRAVAAARQVGAAVGVPLLKGDLVAIVSVHHATPRVWTEADVLLIREVAERTWAAVERARGTAALAESERKVHTLAETAPAFVWFNDEAGANVFVNQAFLAFTGRSAEQIAGEGWHSLVHPDQKRSYVESYLEAVRTRTAWQGRNRLRHADGTWRWFDNYARPLFQGDGSYRGHVGVSIGIDDKVRAEEALRRIEERQRLTLELVPAMLWWADPAGHHIEITPQWSAYTGQSLLETQDFGWLDAIHPDDRKATEAAFRHAFATGEPLERQQRIYHAEDGYRWHLVRHVPVRGQSGKINGWFGAAIDIHEMHELQERQAFGEQQLRTLVEGVPQLVWRACAGGLWTWSSPQWTAYTGLSAAQSAGSGWLAALHPDERAGAEAAWNGASAGAALTMEVRVYSAAESRYRWFATRATPLFDAAGKAAEWLGTLTDIHDLRELQEQEHVLVAELQHRTRNLMGVVRATMESTLRSSTTLDDFIAEYRDRIGALSRVQGLLSRMNVGDRITFDKLIEDEMKAVGASDQVRLEGPRGVALRSSTVQTFALALHELATNAVKYGALAQPSGRLAISWRLEPAPVDGPPWLHVDWHESGVAMPTPGADPRGGGQGRQLIERALPYQLGAKTTYVMGPDGVRCSIAVPVSKRTATEGIVDDRATPP